MPQNICRTSEGLAELADAFERCFNAYNGVCGAVPFGTVRIKSNTLRAVALGQPKVVFISSEIVYTGVFAAYQNTKTGIAVLAADPDLGALAQGGFYLCGVVCFKGPAGRAYAHFAKSPSIYTMVLENSSEIHYIIKDTFFQGVLIHFCKNGVYTTGSIINK